VNAELNGVLRPLVEGVHDALGDSFVGAYLQGSFAVGDFDCALAFVRYVIAESARRGFSLESGSRAVDRVL
jgi:hypothetical protein